MENQVSSKIQKYLGMKGTQRLGIEDNVTETILAHDATKTPGISLEFLTSRKRKLENGSWTEYDVLYKIARINDTPAYVEYMSRALSELVSEFREIEGIDSFGIDEMKTDESGAYYILFYILKDGE